MLKSGSSRVTKIARISMMLAWGLSVGFVSEVASAAPQQPAKTAPAPASGPTAAASANATTEEGKAGDKKELDTSVESDKAIYFSGDIAFTRASLGGISNNLGFDRTSANGALWGLSGGVRLRDLRFGARWRVYDTTEFALWSFALSAGYALPLRPLSPIFSVHAGYVFDQSIEPSLVRSSLPAGTVMPPSLDVKGLLVGLDLNASYWITQFLRLGAFAGVDVMVLHRAQADAPRTYFGPSPEVAGNPLYSDSGSGVGINFNIGLRGAFDIAFQ